MPAARVAEEAPGLPGNASNAASRAVPAPTHARCLPGSACAYTSSASSCRSAPLLGLAALRSPQQSWAGCSVPTKAPSLPVRRLLGRAAASLATATRFLPLPVSCTSTSTLRNPKLKAKASAQQKIGVRKRQHTLCWLGSTSLPSPTGDTALPSAFAQPCHVGCKHTQQLKDPFARVQTPGQSCCGGYSKVDTQPLRGLRSPTQRCQREMLAGPQAGYRARGLFA